MSRTRSVALLAAAIALLGSLAGCGDRGRAERRELVVLAAASLTEAFGEIGRAFEASHPGVVVRFSFGPSDGLAAQIREGAPADVFASASPAWMDDVEENGPGVLHRAVFARNRLVVITPADDPGDVSDLRDLARPGLRLVLAAPGVPAGDYARQVLENAGIADRALANLVSNEEDVKAVVQKVALGEADAGIVYATDVTPAVREDLRTVEIPDAVNVIAVYPIGIIASSEHRDLARAFVEEVLGPGQAILRRYGFLPP
ncbi:MAG TPA: molybdate ABC transporter substrate-binding protein [Actinomycetota bacterium]|nr:molybdate ABC transporter substrate-binding protein [Actinomycetota bacterium]